MVRAAKVIPLWFTLSCEGQVFQMRYRRAYCCKGYVSEFGSLFWSDDEIEQEGIKVEPWTEHEAKGWLD